MDLYIGLMSGTSMDGIDAALIDLSANHFIAGLTSPYSTETKQYLNNVVNGKLGGLEHICQLNTLLGRDFANAALELLTLAKVEASSVLAIGSHGQTVCHEATAAIPYTLQLGCAHTIAELTGITVVADFRTRDLVLGGQGAPFAPIYHQALFGNQAYPLAAVNIGGIANLSYMKTNEEVSGYDLGPGNCLMDSWVNKHLGYDYDHDGAWAATGQVIPQLLDALLKDPYFKRELPKSIGKEYFSMEWLTGHLQPDYTVADVQRTLLQLTAQTIAEGILAVDKLPQKVLVCGGGAHNSMLMKILAGLLPDMTVESTAAINIDPDFIEALMFAWFAEKCLSKKAVDLRSITGAKKAAILGAIYPAGIDKRNWLGV